MCFVHMEDRAWDGYLTCAFHSISVVLLFFLFFWFFFLALPMTSSQVHKDVQVTEGV